jgi:hypothetical protein
MGLRSSAAKEGVGGFSMVEKRGVGWEEPNGNVERSIDLIKNSHAPNHRLLLIFFFFFSPPVVVPFVCLFPITAAYTLPTI